jgi:hypothetical protein
MASSFSLFAAYLLPGFRLGGWCGVSGETQFVLIWFWLVLFLLQFMG